MNQLFEASAASRGYRRERTYENGAVLYARVQDFKVHLLLYFEERPGVTLDLNWMMRVRDDAFRFFSGMNYSEINCLTVFWTPRIGQVSSLARSMAPIWFVDTNRLQLVIFDNQPSDFDGFRMALQQSLDRGIRAWNERSVQQNAGNQMAGRRNAAAFIKSRGICNLLMIGTNIVVFIILGIMGSTTNTMFMVTHGAMYVPWVIERGMWYTVFTSMFLHFGFSHLANNMIVLYIVGDNLERAVGHWKYLVIYLAGGLCGNLLSLENSLRTEDYAVSAGASGAIFAVIGALLYIVIRNKGRLEDLSSMQLLLIIGCTLYCGFVNTGIDNAAHIGGLLGGIVLGIILYHKKRKQVNC